MNETKVILHYQFDPLAADGSTRVTARLTLPGQDPEGGTGTVRFRLDELDRLRNQPGAYRTLLTEDFFNDRRIHTPLVQARMAQRTGGVMLQVNFEIPKDAVRLHAVRWELMGDPDVEGSPPLGQGERVFFSRILLPTNPRPRDAGARRLKAVALVANPRVDAKGNALRFDPIDVAEEQRVANQHLSAKTDLRLLSGANSSWRRLGEELSAGCDILYLACHGTLIEDQPQVYLEQAGECADVLTAEALAQRLRELRAVPPRLVMMAACQSAGGGALSEREDQGFLSSFAARLVDAGVPAVVGMQGNVTQDTSLAFVKKLLASVLSDGQTERAVSLARAEVQGRDDWWMPVLVMSSASGGPLWETRPEFQNWNSLLGSFAAQECLPILGPGIVPELSNLNFALYLREKMGGALLMGRDPEPSKIAQAYKVINNRTENGVEIDLRKFIGDTLIRAGTLPKKGEDLDAWVRRWGAAIREQPSGRILNMLAALPAPVFVTTNGDSLLQQAMERLDPPKHPETEILPWWGEWARIQGLKDRREGPDLPTSERPLVHHLFGHYRETGSLVITEDDFFDYLIWLATNRESVWIRTKLCDSSLLFLGFRLEDWEFRLLLRSIAKLPGSENLKTKTHVAVQIEDTGEADQRDQIKSQLEAFFKNSDVELSIYFARVEEFLTELQNLLEGAGLIPRPVPAEKKGEG